MNIRCFVISAGCAGLLVAGASGQSLNIDFGIGAGAPLEDYAGAALPGVWNAVTAPPGVASPLVDLSGSPVDATVIWGDGTYFSATEPAADPPHGFLMDDGIRGAGDIITLIQFTDLLPGAYEIIVYGWNAINPSDHTLVILGDFAQHEVVGGKWPGSLLEGVTHTTFQWDVLQSGVLEIGFVGSTSNNDGAVNGIQLRKIVPGDLNGDGMVNVTDLLILFDNWGACDDCDDCPADLDGDCVVNVTDLLILFDNWT